MDNSKLTRLDRFEGLRRENGLTLEQLAERTGLSSSALGSYENDETKDISHRAVIALAEFYGVSTDYLLGLVEQKNHPDAEVLDLHLSDEMIDILRSGKINNRLLGELVTHKGFHRFLVDAEIYIDRIADMRVNDMNTFLEATRQQILQQSSTDENDLNARTLELAQVDEDGFFAHVVHKDMDVILRDIRDAHRMDSTTADVDSPVGEIQKLLREALSYEGSDEERQVRILCYQLGIPYDKLTPEEFTGLIAALQKSKAYRTAKSQRGRAVMAHRRGKRKKKP